MDTLTDRLQVLQSESTRLRQYLYTLSPDAWRQPSACAQWQVQDVVAHLIGGAEFFADSITRVLQGDASPPAGRPPAGTINAAVASESVAQRAIVVRERLGDQLLTTFEATDDHLTRLLTGLGPQDQDKTCYHVWRLMPAQDFANLRIQELALHGWDIRSRLEATAQLSAESVAVLLDMIAGSFILGFLTWAFWAGPKLSTPVHYRFEVTDTVPSTSDIVVEGDTARVEEVGPTPAHVYFRCDPEAYVLVMYGRLSLTAAIAAGRVGVAGDRQMATVFGQWFKGI